MGTAWHAEKSYPWEQGLYVGGIETVKVNITHRIYSNKWHVYAGLALLNPHARIQIEQYAKSATEIFKLMLDGEREALRKRVYSARNKVFPEEGKGKAPILLSESVLDQFTLSRASASGAPSTKVSAQKNSHLSILAMVDSWAALDILPFAHLSLAATPIFRLWIGVAEALYRSPASLDLVIDAAISHTLHRTNDLEFVIAARGWSQCVSFGSFKLYEERFASTRAFFEGRFEEAAVVGSRMIKAVLDEATAREKEADLNNDGASKI
jgi:prephenate dehydrogenase (NADP+)